MCTETIVQYTCGCSEVKEIIFCEFLLQPAKGHYANGEQTKYEVVTVDAAVECERCSEKGKKEREEEERKKGKSKRKRGESW
ncbi:hypothetical protein ONS95_011671 [Cadophora gregata]|uniref:uncharacterized protein n=1 Tax=Cadophora gregata TaxID=51156 RepID=UPI0026DCB7ED|nr:uncharacterized protein ONS95_011671 [Cadophora gregata]KAK0120266.1 hypothetical protein ONS95_011671 [Cadophora gregata]